LLRSSLLFKFKGVPKNNVEKRGHFWTHVQKFCCLPGFLFHRYCGFDV
jgi:hypothetical protein